MSNIPDDIFTEPDFSPDTLANLGPLRRLAGVWQSDQGEDINPKADGPERRVFREHIRMDPIDPQTNGPQLLYGLRYHIHINTPEEAITFHDQVGYWLWEPATATLYQTVSIPRAITLLAIGQAAPDATRFELRATRGTTANGIVASSFLEAAFTTVEFRIVVEVHADGSWSYDEDTVMRIRGQSELFHHRDVSTLTRIGAPAPNPLAAARR